MGNYFSSLNLDKPVNKYDYDNFDKYNKYKNFDKYNEPIKYPLNINYDYKPYKPSLKTIYE